MAQLKTQRISLLKAREKIVMLSGVPAPKLKDAKKIKSGSMSKDGLRGISVFKHQQKEKNQM